MAPESATLVRRPAILVRGGTLATSTGTSVAITPEGVTVGRDPSATLALQDSEVSAVHCELRATAEGVIVRDLGSTNGTFVGSVAIHEARLTGSCKLRVGQTELSFEPEAGKHPVEAELEAAFGPLVGSSPVMRRLYKVMSRVAATDLSVLITGETGSGKDLVAQAIHGASPRKDAPFVVVDCGAIPTGLAESILFGHEKGSFTGATQRKSGVFQNANGGTVFLDELGELPIELQPKLLRVIADHAVKRLGGASYEPIDVRVIAATRRDLRREVNANHFRSDLFFRIAQVAIDLPPLRDRRQDFGLLVERACERIHRADHARRIVAIIQARFENYDWPGNVRELMNVASVLASMEGGVGDESYDLLLPLEKTDDGTQDSRSVARSEDLAFAEAKRTFEHDYFSRLQDVTDGNISEIARRCGLARHQVRAHLRKLGLIPE
ncbi:MAG: sigma 54-dependent Fis family transcriptional regulator [Deltaproteobacteria bacterium]|nr:sigma 54-dependent Fis family transcriptional regulator [Deltaproteobacteria bacterium]